MIFSQHSEQDSSQPSADTELRHTPAQKESTSDIDYFEKFTLVDVVVPGERVTEQQEEAEQFAAKPRVEEQKSAKETATESLSASEDSFVFVSDEEIIGEHLDEVFYGEPTPADAPQQRDYEAVGGSGMRRRRESHRSVKESGSVLFESEETILTPIFISSGPPKIIDPILLEEPTAMSFMYSDLYEDAVGERRKSDEEFSEAESMASEKSYKRRLSDSEEADGYLEKFTLKDETPAVEVQPESEQDRREGRMMWPQSKFEMTGCLTRVVREEDENKTKREEPKTQEVGVGDRTEGLKSATFEAKMEIVTETEKEGEKTSFSAVTEEQPAKEPSKELIQESKVRGDQIVDQKMKDKVKRDRTEPPETSTDEPPPGTEQEEHLGDVPAETIITETDQLCQTREVGEKAAQVVVKATEESIVMASASTEEGARVTAKSEIQTKTSENSLSEEAAIETKTVDEKVFTEAPAEETETEFAGREMITTTTSLCEEREAAAAPEDVAPIEVIADCDAAVHAVVEVTEKAVDEKEIQTQVQIDLQEAKSTEATAAQAAAPDGEEICGAVTNQTAVMSQVSHQESEGKSGNEVTEPEMPEQVKTGLDKKMHGIESKQHQQEESVSDRASVKAKLIPAAKEETSTKDRGNNVHEMVNVDDELILLVPKGQAVEMDIEVSPWSEKSISDTVAPSEPDSKFEGLIAPHTTTMFPETQQAPNGETMTEPRPKPKDGQKEDVLPIEELHKRHSPPAPVEEVNAEEKKFEWAFEKDEGVFSPLRSFTPQENLSGMEREAMWSEATDVEQKVKIHKVEDATERNDVQENSGPDADLPSEDKGQMMAPEGIIEELEYELICEQDAKEMTEPERQRDTEEPKPERGQGDEDRMKTEVRMEEEEEKVFDLSLDEELIEAGYEIIDAEEERQARLAAELQGMDWFCLTCGYLLSEDDCALGEHRSHEVTAVDTAYEEMKVRFYLF